MPIWLWVLCANVNAINKYVDMIKVRICNSVQKKAVGCHCHIVFYDGGTDYVGN